MTKILLLCAVVLFVINVNGQSSARQKYKISYTGFAGIGVGMLRSDPSYRNSFPVPEARLGIGLEKKITERLAIKSRLALGVKFKREPINSGYIHYIGPPFSQLDEMSSANTYTFLEIPLIVQYEIKTSKIAESIGLRFGGNVRHMNARNHYGPPYLPNEFGLLAGAQVKLSDRVSVGIDYYHGLTTISAGSWTIYNNTGYADSGTFKVWSQFVQIGMDYRLSKSGKANWK